MGPSGFLLNTFVGEATPLFIRPQLQPEAIVSGAVDVWGDKPDVQPWTRSIRKPVYLERIGKLIGQLADTGGKTVISRAICGSDVQVDWIAVARTLFARFSDTYRFLYYTPQTGAWLGASPEILLEYDRPTEMVTTMALAGTRQYGTAGEWDSKNVREHKFVTDYIVRILAACRLQAAVGPAENVRYGIVEHLCHRITVGEVAPQQIIPIMAALSPTPALAGYPLWDAIEHITTIEDYPRICYGGFVGNVDNGNVRCYVNLRSVHFSDNAFCMMVGGGITSDSDPLREWDETEAKSSILNQIINENSRHGAGSKQ